MENERSERNYGAKALLPLLLFLVLYVGCGVYFTIKGGIDRPFWQFPRYTAILIAVLVAIFFYDMKKSVQERATIWYKNAGRPGTIQLGLIVLLAGGFAEAVAAIGGKESIINLGVTLIPNQLLIPGIFVICCIISTCIGTSMGTMVTMMPVAFALAEGAGLNLAMAGAATITGSYFGDNLSMISDTTICAVEGVGADLKEKFKFNGTLSILAGLATAVLYAFLSNGGSVDSATQAGNYNLFTILPYFIVLILAIFGMDVVMVLGIGLASTLCIGLVSGTDIFVWAQAVSTGMEGMFWLAVFAMMISGLVGLIRYYGGIDWLVGVGSKGIKGRKSCEFVSFILSFFVSSVIVNNTMAIMLSSSVAKEFGEKYRVNANRLAAFLDIGACMAVMVVPHGSGALMVQEQAGVTYLEILQYSFYPMFLIILIIGAIQLSNREEKI